VGRAQAAPRVLLTDAFDRGSLDDAAIGRAVQPDVKAAVLAEHDCRRAAQDHAAAAVGEQAVEPRLAVAAPGLGLGGGGRRGPGGWGEGGDGGGRVGIAWVRWASSRCTGVTLPSSADSCSSHGPGSATWPSDVVTRCRKGRPSRSARAGAMTLPPAP